MDARTRRRVLVELERARQDAISERDLPDGSPALLAVFDEYAESLAVLLGTADLKQRRE